MATKQLRLDVAQLTDVGRKREHNEDNMAYVIPKDPLVMARKGALFIVADGMGGHAAGEVASEIAVDTVSTVYYQDESDDSAEALLHAIKRANIAIHQRAAENMLRSGMGTTCITAALCGNIAYIANVGDSRAYLIRRGQVRQISQDHSWVAEQVRAGLLTEDQARTHAQRNVITRCLGTQADVEIDVFSEPLEEGDSLVLCTDGLSGLVADDELLKIVDQFVPQESVYHLVERANENGGPDNITAIVVRVQEVDSSLPDALRPVHAGRRETNSLPVPQTGSPSTTAPLDKSGGYNNTVPLAFGPPSVGVEFVPAFGPLRISSGPLAAPDIDTAPQPIVRVRRRSRGRLFYPTIVLIVLLVVTLAGGLAYTIFHPTASPAVAQSLQQARRLIAQARSEVSSNPALALQHLASAQKTLQSVAGDQLNPDQRTQVNSLLHGDLTTTVQAAIRSYNQRTAITAVPCPTITASTPINEGSTGTHVQRLAAVQDVTYALGQDYVLYQLRQVNGQTSLVNPLNLTVGMQVLDLAGDASHLALLLKASAANLYSVAVLLPGQSQVHSAVNIDPSLLANGEVPTFIAMQGADLYVLLAAPLAANTAQNALVLDFPLDARGNLKATPLRIPLSVSAAIAGVAAFPNHLLLLLLANGQVQSLQLTTAGSSPLPIKTPLPTNVVVQPPIAPALAADASSFMPTTAVPLVVTPATPTGPLPLVTSQTATLTTGVVGTTAHLYIADAADHRLLNLVAAAPATPPGNPLTLKVVQQYASPALFAQMKSLAVDTRSQVASVLTQNASSVSTLVSINTAVQAPASCV